MSVPFFEHIAIAVQLDDLVEWDRMLRTALGGTVNGGGEEPRIGFQGGQIDFPDRGMLELVTWMAGSEEKAAMKRYVDRQGGRAALHHLTFLVPDFAAAVDHCRALEYEPRVGRDGRRWKEFYVRDPGLGPDGFLVQVLWVADKETLMRSQNRNWGPFATSYPASRAPCRIAGVQLASSDLTASERLFVELLGAETRAAESGRELSFPTSSMRVWLGDGVENEVRVAIPDDGPDLTARIADGPEAAAALLAPVR